MKPTTLSIQMTTSDKNEGNLNPADILLQTNPFNTDTDGHRKSPYSRGIRIERDELRENARVFLPQGQSKLSVIMRCQYKAESVKRVLTVFLHSTCVY